MNIFLTCPLKVTSYNERNLSHSGGRLTPQDHVCWVVVNRNRILAEMPKPKQVPQKAEASAETEASAEMAEPAEIGCFGRNTLFWPK